MTNPAREASSTTIPRWRLWTILFLIYTALFFFFFEYHYLDDLSRHRVGTLGVRLLEEGTGVYTVFLMLPLILRFARFYLFEREGWMQRIAWHAAGAVFFSFLHTSLMAVSRWILAPLLGMGHYDYGIMTYRYPMELSNDVMGYTVTVLLYYSVRRYQISQAEKLAAAELQTKLAQA